MNNYPDDIRSWDWHPDSPFYQGPADQEEADALQEAADLEADAAYERMREQEGSWDPT